MKSILVALIGFSGTALASGGPSGVPAKTSQPNKGAVRLEVKVTSEGFALNQVQPLKVGQPVTLVVTRTTDRTCAKDIVLEEFGISRPLPLNQPVEVTFVAKKVGSVHFACAMGMVGGDLKVQ